MVHTLPDYSTKYKMDKVFANTDNAELAARLGSINIFDRRGNIMGLSDFETNLSQWVTGGTGTGNSVEINIEQARTGTASCKMTTGDLATNYAYIGRKLPYYDLTKMGYEISFIMDGDVKELDLYMYLFDGTNIHNCLIEYYPQVNDLRAETGNAGVYTIDSDLDLFAYEKLFHTFKTTADFKNDIYGDVIINNHHYDLSNYTIGTGPNVTSPHLYYYFKVITNVNDNVSIFVDNFIATSDEP